MLAVDRLPLGDRRWRPLECQSMGGSVRLDVEAPWVLEEAVLPPAQFGCVDWPRRVVTVDCRLSAAQRRCTLAHELVHIERGPVPRDPWLAAREEAAVEAEAARRLIPLDALAGALAWSRRPDEVAEELWVDVQTLAVRIGGLSDVERRWGCGSGVAPICP